MTRRNHSGLYYEPGKQIEQKSNETSIWDFNINKWSRQIYKIISLTKQNYNSTHVRRVSGSEH